MARFFGKVGYGTPQELVGGVWQDTIEERDYYGTIESEARSLVPTDQVNDDLRLSNKISIVADAYAFKNFHLMKYVMVAGSPWKVMTVEVKRPRLILTLGGVYNGPRA